MPFNPAGSQERMALIIFLIASRLLNKSNNNIYIKAMFFNVFLLNNKISFTIRIKIKIF